MKSLTLTHEGWEFGFAKFQFIEISTQTLGHVCFRHSPARESGFLHTPGKPDKLEAAETGANIQGKQLRDPLYACMGGGNLVGCMHAF
ncbi:MAG: hypothetical protein IJN23_08165 [Akkermansia sp.]|nr:hypothetical protein [Akkermansia sp.]